MTISPMDRLRRIAAATIGDDGEWFRAALGRYEAGARDGVSIGDALGLRPAPGASPWWELEARRKRNAILRRLHASQFPGLKIGPAAREIAKLGRRYQASAWQRGEVPADGSRQLLNEALATGLPFPGARQLRTILGNEI